jgi:hypothetical protein
MKTFFLWIGRMGYQKIRFLCSFQTCTFNLRKKCTQKRFAQKTDFSWDFLRTCKGQKCMKQLSISKKRVLLTDLRFSYPFQNCMSHNENIKILSKSLDPTADICTVHGDWRDSIFDPRSLPDLLDWLWLGDTVDPESTVVDGLGDHQVSVRQDFEVV